MSSYFNLLYSISTIIENYNDIYFIIQDYLECISIDKITNNEIYSNLSFRLWKIQYIINQVYEDNNSKFFFGIIQNTNNYPIIWDSSAYSNSYDDHINSNVKLANLINHINSINNFIEKYNEINDDILSIKNSYFERIGIESINPSLVIPIFLNNKIICFILIHAWIYIDDRYKNNDRNKDIYYAPNNLIIDNKNNNFNYDDIRNITREAIRYNLPIEDKLNVVICMSNPCKFKTRVKLAKEFISRMKYEEYVNLYVVELAYDCNPVFEITEEHNSNHLQLRTKTPLWHKENMINVGILKLLPEDWKAVAWIDADIEFDNPLWALDTLKLLNGSFDVVQLFNIFIHMRKDKNTMGLNTSFGYKYTKGDPYSFDGSKPNFWHPGFAWACTRSAFEQMRGIHQLNILGAGDYILAICLKEENVNDALSKINDISCRDVNIEFFNRCKGLRLGYTPGVIRHYYHGSIANRHYIDRYQIFAKHKYRPSEHITYDKDGILIPTDKFSDDFKEDIYKYFQSRKEDDY
jgi:hypothetical protein